MHNNPDERIGHASMLDLPPFFIYNRLIKAAADTLKAFAAPKHLGAVPGITAVLHTWSQNLGQHPHVHCVVTGGGLSPDGECWIACKRDHHGQTPFRGDRRRRQRTIERPNTQQPLGDADGRAVAEHLGRLVDTSQAKHSACC